MTGIISCFYFAIAFCGFYSIELPPELLGLNVLSEKDIAFIADIYQDFLEDIKAKYLQKKPKSRFHRF
ncbi:MAG: hypothetical protein J7L47_10090 [Candidatus Odinarchaeota archaeon]|nr:hypothetical protein [Candidatus Odinarchaeota archaeon]